jgi:DNA (cytosine-5)-methyltransferase 1
MADNTNSQSNELNIDPEDIIWTDREFSYPKRTIRLGTSFSGIGAIEYAFKRLGLNSRIVFAGDIDKNCKESYFANYDIRENQWHRDIHDFDATPFKGKIDLFVGGAPCQAFSIVGDQRGFDDTRGTLFREFARVVKECQPKVFIFENVQGLFKHDHGRTWEVIYNTFRDYCGYDVHYQLLNARDYGIPQTRERLYCIGFKTPTEFKYPSPIPLKYKMFDFLEDYTDSKFYDANMGAKILSPNEEHRNELIKGTEEERFNDFVFKVKEVEDKYYLSEKVSKYVLCSGTKTFKTPIKTDLDIARPLLQSMHKMHRAGVDNYVSYNKTKGINGLRKLTPRECLRLMGFKDDFKIAVSNTSAYMEAGNSIVVDVLIALLKQLDITKYGIDNEE